MIKNMRDLQTWAKRNGHKVERWRTDDKSCYHIRFYAGKDYEIISAQYFYWVLYRIVNEWERRGMFTKEPQP